MLLSRYLIIEPRSSGHLLVYVRILATYARDHGHSVTLALSPEAFQSQEMTLHLGNVAESTIVAAARVLLSPRGIARLSRQVDADFVIVPHADEMAPRMVFGLGYRGVGRVRLLIMRDPRWEFPTPLRRHLRNAIKRVLLGIASRLPRVELVWLRQPSFVSASSELFAIDPFIADGSWGEIQSEGDRLRKALQLEPGVFWFGMTGAITGRKNLKMVLEALAILREHRPSDRIGFAVVGPIMASAGETASSIRSECDRIGIDCRVEDRLLSNFEMNGVVVALDAIVMAYSSFSPNSTLGKSWVLGTRLVAAGPPSVQGFVRSLGVGLWSELASTAIAANMGHCLDIQAPGDRHDALTADAFAAAVLGIDITDNQTGTVPRAS